MIAERFGIDEEFGKFEIDPQSGNFTSATGTWYFRNLAPGQKTELIISTNFRDEQEVVDSTEDRLVIGSGEIVSSTPRERPEYLHNNATREAWKYNFKLSDRAAEGNAIVEMQGSEDRFPEANDTVDVTVRFWNAVAYPGSLYASHDMYDVRVKLTPSPGLALVRATAPRGTFGTSPNDIEISSSFNLSTGIWNLGSVPENVGGVIYIDMPVTVRYTGAAPLEQACLTAELVNIVPPERPDNPDIQRDSKAGVCLGNDPRVLLRGEIGDHITPATDGDGFPLFHLYPCVGETAYPCNDQDTLELVTFISREDMRERDVGIGRFDADIADFGHAVYLQPESIVLQVEDTPVVRKENVASPVWRTGSEHDNDANDAGLIPGPAVSFRLPSPDYAKYKFAISPVGTLPGSMKFISPSYTPFTFLNLENKLSEGPWSVSDGSYETFVEFGDLGTYVVDLTIEATHTDTSTTYTATSTTHRAPTGRYTFHVGPAAELEVRDAGANLELPSGKRAYTIMAVNNGPDIPPAAQVMLADVPEGAEAVASQGSYDQGVCDEDGLCQGVWTIGELRLSDFYRASGLPGDGPTLTLITDAAIADPITATIENTQDYCVRIKSGGEFSDDRECTGSLPAGYTEHSAAYYDYTTSDCIDSTGEKVAASSRSDCETTSGNSWHSNDRDVQIASHAGTGRLHPDAPRSLRVDKFGSLALLRWQPPESGAVNRFGITHYQVERNGVVVADDVTGIMYVDLRGGAVNQAFRVRAVNDQEVPGPWSRPIGTSGPLERPGELAAPNGLTATPGVGVGRIDLRWFAPSADNSLRYVIEHATDGAGPWTTLASRHSGTTYSHTGAILLPSTTHYYRVATVRGNDISAWAYAQATTEAVDEDGEPAWFDPPGWPMNLRFTRIDRTAVTLAWDPPADDGGSRITGYEYRVFGPCASGADAVCDIVAPTRVSGTSRSISGLNREGPYEFQVRALNAVGAGDWSQSIQKDVGPATAGGGRVILSPSRLTVAEGGEATYRVKLSTSPTMPLFVTLHWDGTGAENLGGELPFQQFKILLPSGYDAAGLPEWCSGIRLDWEDEAYAWNVGVPITVVAAEDDDSDHDSLTILHSIYTLSAECLNNPADYALDPVYDGMFGLALEVTERDND